MASEASEARTRSLGFLALQKVSIKQVVLASLFIQLRHERRGRQQCNGENFFHFVHNNRKAAEVLQLPV